MHSRTPHAFLLLALVFQSLPPTAQAGINDRRSPLVVAVSRSMPSVVNLSSQKRVLNRTSWSNSATEQRVNGMGAGVIVDERGFIITNAHVVDKVTKLRATLSDGRVFDAHTLAVDAKTDLALVKIETGSPLPIIPMGTSNDLMLAESVLALGNPYGYSNTVTRGVISALDRTVKLNDDLTYYDLIQTDASINPGNSGGALVNVEGDLIGVNVAIRAGAQGISFAIPIDTVKVVAAELLSSQNGRKVWHGISYRDVQGTQSDMRVLVRKVEGPAKDSGIMVGDRIVQIDNSIINCGLALERAMLDRTPGETVEVIVERNEGQKIIKVSLNGTPQLSQAPTEQVWSRLGFRLSAVGATEVRRYQPQLNGAMYILEIRSNSAASRSGLREGDLLLGLQQWETLKYEDVLFVLAQPVARTNQIKAHVLRGGVRYEFNLNTAR